MVIMCGYQLLQVELWKPLALPNRFGGWLQHGGSLYFVKWINVGNIKANELGVNVKT